MTGSAWTTDRSSLFKIRTQRLCCSTRAVQPRTFDFSLEPKACLIWSSSSHGLAKSSTGLATLTCRYWWTVECSNVCRRATESGSEPQVIGPLSRTLHAPYNISGHVCLWRRLIEGGLVSSARGTLQEGVRAVSEDSVPALAAKVREATSPPATPAWERCQPVQKSALNVAVERGNSLLVK